MQNSNIYLVTGKQIIKIALSIIFLVIIFHRVNLEAVITQISTLPVHYLILAGIVYLSSVAVLAIKWWVLIQDSDYKQILKMTYIGIFYSMLVPGQIAGDGVKAYKMSKITGNGVAVGYSVLLDKIIGFLIITLLTIIGLKLSDIEINTIYLLNIGLLFGFLLFLLFTMVNPALFYFIKRCLSYMINTRQKLNTKIENINRSIESSIDSIHLHHILLNSLFGMIYLGVCIFSNIIILHGFGYSIAFSEWLWITGVMVLIVLVPVSIGGLGLREGSLIVLLGFFGVPSAIALSVSLIGFSYQLINVVIGFALNIRDNTSSVGKKLKF